MSDKQYDNEMIYATLGQMRDQLENIKKEYNSYKRRTQKEIKDLTKYRDQHLLECLIPAIENLWHAYKNTDINSDISICARSFFNCLKQSGVTVYEPPENDEFDCSYMNAVMTQPTNRQYLINKVATCVSPGFAIDDKIIKYAQVSVYSSITY